MRGKNEEGETTCLLPIENGFKTPLTPRSFAAREFIYFLVIICGCFWLNVDNKMNLSLLIFLKTGGAK